MTGASCNSFETRAPSSVADITKMRRSGRSDCLTSSASASPKSASSERSWNSSNSTAPMPLSSGSSRIIRVNTPSVITSMRVAGPVLDASRARNPIMPPSLSPTVLDMRSAAPRAAMRRGSRTRILPPSSHDAFNKARGTRVVLPAPGGATNTAIPGCASAVAMSASTSSIGRGASNFMGVRCL